MKIRSMIKVVGWFNVLTFVGCWLVVLLLFQGASIVAAYYGVEREQAPYHWALIGGFAAGLILFYLVLYRPLKENSSTANEMISRLMADNLKLLEYLSRKDNNDKTDPDWWKNDKGRDN